MTTLLTLLIPALIGYLLGSIPFGLILTKLAGLGDIRGIGSGNIGATNVLRTGKKSLAFLTLLLDGGKGTAAVLLMDYLLSGTGQFAGIAALLGHIFPVWLKFKGGKGVATSFGVLLGLAWPVGICAMLVWLIVAVSLRISSLSALVAIALTPTLAFALGYNDLFWVTVVIVVLIFVKHKANIRRLLSGTEPKIGAGK